MGPEGGGFLDKAPVELPGSVKPRKTSVRSFPLCWRDGTFPGTGGGNNGGAGANKLPVLVSRPLLGWLGAGWGFERMFCSSDDSSLTLVVLLGGVEVTVPELATGLVVVAAELFDVGFD